MTTMANDEVVGAFWKMYTAVEAAHNATILKRGHVGDSFL